MSEIEAQAQIVVRIWDRLGMCYDEFTTDGSADNGREFCAEYEEALDSAIVYLMRLVDPERYQRREQRLRDASTPPPAAEAQRVGAQQDGETVDVAE